MVINGAFFQMINMVINGYCRWSAWWLMVIIFKVINMVINGD